MARVFVPTNPLRFDVSFYTEPGYYQKTILSDLQGAWLDLRDAVLEDHQHIDCAKLLFHIDEAMSWESVRNLAHMKNTFVLIQSISQQSGVSDDTADHIEAVRELLYEAIDELRN